MLQLREYRREGGFSRGVVVVWFNGARVRKPRECERANERKSKGERMRERLNALRD